MKFSDTYKVAGHRFRLSIPQSQKLADALSIQYDPFVDCDEDNKEGLLFDLEYAEEVPCGERVCVFDREAEGEEIVVKIYKLTASEASEGGWIFEVSVNRHCPVSTRIWASENFSRAKFTIETKRMADAVFAVNNAAMMVYAFASVGLGTVLMHASVIGYHERAYLFLGISGTGKSTHSSLWLKHIEGAELMNDDNPIVRIYGEGSGKALVIAYGSPWSGKTPCYKNVQAPIGAFVQIKQYPENEISRMNVLESFSSLYASISGIKTGRSAMAAHINDSISAILDAVPCFLLKCRPDEEAARVCHGAVTAL